jgi:hypothetical protein
MASHKWNSLWGDKIIKIWKRTGVWTIYQETPKAQTWCQQDLHQKFAYQFMKNNGFAPSANKLMHKHTIKCTKGKVCVHKSSSATSKEDEIYYCPKCLQAYWRIFFFLAFVCYKVMWDLRWAKWQWGRFSPSTSVSPANSHSDCSTLILMYHPGLVQ